MSFDPTIIGKIYSRISSKAKELDQRLIQEFEPAISNIDQLRFNYFKQCVADKNDTAICFQQAERYELNVDILKIVKNFEECLNKAAGENAFEKQADACLTLYERDVRKNLEDQINRVLKNL